MRYLDKITLLNFLRESKEKERNKQNVAIIYASFLVFLYLFAYRVNCELYRLARLKDGFAIFPICLCKTRKIPLCPRLWILCKTVTLFLHKQVFRASISHLRIADICNEGASHLIFLQFHLQLSRELNFWLPYQSKGVSWTST